MNADRCKPQVCLLDTIVNGLVLGLTPLVYPMFRYFKPPRFQVDKSAQPRITKPKTNVPGTPRRRSPSRAAWRPAKVYQLSRLWALRWSSTGSQTTGSEPPVPGKRLGTNGTKSQEQRKPRKVWVLLAVAKNRFSNTNPHISVEGDTGLGYLTAEQAAKRLLGPFLEEVVALVVHNLSDPVRACASGSEWLTYATTHKALLLESV